MKLDILAIGLCQMRVCATKDCTEPFIEEEVNLREPTGIDSHWHIRRHIEPVFCQCEQDEGRHHLILEC